MDKEVVGYMYNGMLAIKSNKTGPFVMVWISLETVIQNEVNQKEKNKYCILTHLISHMQVMSLLWQKGRGTKEPLDEGEREE